MNPTLETNPLNNATTPIENLSKPSASLRVILIIGSLCILGILAVWGLLPRLAQRHKLEKKVAESQQISVNVMQPIRGSSEVELILPSTTEALNNTPIYARASGYLKEYYADIGEKVAAGTVLAEIETPEVDEQLNQNLALLEQAKANLVLAENNNKRWQGLLKEKAVSKQETDERYAAYLARKADVTAAEANVQRLTRMQSFQKVTAPYAGTIIARTAETGALVNGDNTEQSRMLFRLAQTDTLRVYVNVPQNYYRLIKEGQTVDLSFHELPGKTFPGKVVRTAGALDTATRTLKTEIQVPNEKDELLPGLYAEVKFKILNETPALIIPASTLILNQEGPHVAVVNASGQVRLQAIVLGRDFGKTMEVVSGLEDNTKLVVNPSDTLYDGAIVKVKTVEAKIAAK